MAHDDPESDTVLRSIAFAGIGDLLVLCHSKADPSDAEWETWIQRERRHEHRALLISTDGGAPNSRQRARVAEATRYAAGPRPPVALLTDSAATRHVLTAFAWILGKEHPMRAFRRGGVADAWPWLGTHAPLDRVKAAVERLHGLLGKTAR